MRPLTPPWDISVRYNPQHWLGASPVPTIYELTMSVTPEQATQIMRTRYSLVTQYEPGRLCRVRLVVTEAEAAAIGSGASPLDVLLPEPGTLYVQNLTSEELMTR